MIKVMTVKPKLLDQVRHATRVRHLCPRSQALPGNALHEALPSFIPWQSHKNCITRQSLVTRGGSKARSPNVLKRFDYEIIIIAKMAKNVPL